MKGAYSGQGATLVEILISLLVLSAGVFSMLSLQLSSLKTGRSAYYRTQAYFSAQSLAESLIGASLMEDSERAAWSDELAARLPNADSIVCIDETPDDGTRDAPACDSQEPSANGGEVPSATGGEEPSANGGEEPSARTVIKIWWTDNAANNTDARLSWIVARK